jgi:hypothetical protein
MNEVRKQFQRPPLFFPAVHPDPDGLADLAEKRSAFVAQLESLVESEQEDVRHKVGSGRCQNCRASRHGTACWLAATIEWCFRDGLPGLH